MTPCPVQQSPQSQERVNECVSCPSPCQASSSSFYFGEIKFKFHLVLQALPRPLSFSLTQLLSRQPSLPVSQTSHDKCLLAFAPATSAWLFPRQLLLVRPLRSHLKCGL